jgi:hypothetical protein
MQSQQGAATTTYSWLVVQHTNDHINNTLSTAALLPDGRCSRAQSTEAMPNCKHARSEARVQAALCPQRLNTTVPHYHLHNLALVSS